MSFQNDRLLVDGYLFDLTSDVFVFLVSLRCSLLDFGVDLHLASVVYEACLGVQSNVLFAPAVCSSGFCLPCLDSL